MIIRVCRMDACEKLCRLNELMDPFGYSYIPEQDIMTTTVDAWQREFGYGTIYDEGAVYFNMVFDCEPVYFDYKDQTWLIEIWKGQYGLNTGGEVGIYRADSLLDREQRKMAMFQSVSDSELLPVSMELYKHGKKLFGVMRKHWWLTGFCVGQYSEPEELSLRVSITFPDTEMLQCFTEALEELGYKECDICISCRTIFFTLEKPHSRQPRRSAPGRGRWQQWKNQMYCSLFRIVTKPFTRTSDKILYLYFLLPEVFRRMLRFRRIGQKKWRGR